MSNQDAQWSKIAWVKKHRVNQAQDSLLAAKKHLASTLDALSMIDQQIEGLQDAKMKTSARPWEQELVSAQALVSAEAHMYYLKKELNKASDERKKKAKEASLAEQRCDKERVNLIKMQTRLEAVEKQKNKAIASHQRLQENNENELVTEQWSLSSSITN